MPATRDVIERIVIEHVEAENARDMDWVMRTYAADPVFDDVPSGALFEGKAAIAAAYQERFDAFPDMDRAIDRLTVGEVGAVAEITMRGHQTGVYRGLPPKPEEQVLRIAAHFCVDDDGLITRETTYYDAMTVAVGLGVLPDLDSVPGKLWLLRARPRLIPKLLRARLL